ncbi:Hypothetical protein Minf_0256 [Methylacidiphilum infernorum V4]|uniref:Uncharacterized protein n=1 Tax=Methylacidiphilum infernorum (isolate V4) TaxID=481448 RepID=B3DY39_METI4|nr:Hypothetical protein Minf_0256 [Methylacidiphilum infernorum V4]
MRFEKMKRQKTNGVFKKKIIILKKGERKKLSFVFPLSQVPLFFSFFFYIVCLFARTVP